MADKYTYLGKAVAYPIRLQAGAVKTVSGKETIKSALTMIFTTPVGTRELVPWYGWKGSELRWEPNDDILETQLRFYTIDAINRCESRIELITVAIATKDDLSLIRVLYRIKASNEVDSYVFPYSRKPLPY